MCRICEIEYEGTPVLYDSLYAESNRPSRNRSVAARHGIGKWANNFNVCRSCNFDYSSFGRFLTDLTYRKLLSVKTDESDFKDSSNVALIVKECDINPNDVK